MLLDAGALPNDFGDISLSDSLSDSGELSDEKFSTDVPLIEDVYERKVAEKASTPVFSSSDCSGSSSGTK